MNRIKLAVSNRMTRAVEEEETAVQTGKQAKDQVTNLFFSVTDLGCQIIKKNRIRVQHKEKPGHRSDPTDKNPIRIRILILEENRSGSDPLRSCLIYTFLLLTSIFFYLLFTVYFASDLATIKRDNEGERKKEREREKKRHTD